MALVVSSKGKIMMTPEERKEEREMKRLLALMGPDMLDRMRERKRSAISTPSAVVNIKG